jgi:hypothetical protein
MPPNRAEGNVACGGLLGLGPADGFGLVRIEIEVRVQVRRRSSRGDRLRFVRR